MVNSNTGNCYGRFSMTDARNCLKINELSYTVALPNVKRASN